MPGKWAGSRRVTRLPADWPARREAVRARDGYQCTWTDAGARCTGGADEVDHIDRHAGDDEHNLRSLCTYHHRRKSSAEGNATRWRYRQSRDREPHPGIVH